MQKWLRKSMFETLKDGDYSAQLTTSVGVVPSVCFCQVSFLGNVFSSDKKLSWQDGETWAESEIEKHKRHLTKRAPDALRAYDMGEVNGVKLTYVKGNVFATPAKRR